MESGTTGALGASVRKFESYRPDQQHQPIFISFRTKNKRINIMLCEYNCGNEAKYKLKNGRNICCESPNKCPSIRKKNSEIKKKNYRFPIPKYNPANFKVSCIYCRKEITYANRNRHINTCYLNPQNITLCPVCNTPIKDYKNNKTCSSKCGKQYFLHMYAEFGREAGIKRSQTIPDIELGYRKLCFRYHKKKCIICGEENIVAVHHYDENKYNNDPRNLVPLCPTHHSYLHSLFAHLIIGEVRKYVQNFELLFEVKQQELISTVKGICKHD